MEFNDRRSGTKHSESYGVLDGAQKADYTKAYQSGWRHSSSARADMGNDPHAHTDEFKSKAWQDGYLDNAVGREKFALRGHRFGTGDPVEGY